MVIKTKNGFKIAICIKQVPENQAEMNWKSGRIERKNIPLILNPDDYHAIEMGLTLKEQYGGTIHAFTMGPPQAEEILREAYSFGVDKCFLISDPVFAGSDSLITSKILAQALNKFGPYDIIITGKRSLDGDTGHVSYQLAELLNVPHLTRIQSIQIESGRTIRVERIYGHEYQTVKTNLPVVLAVDKTTNDVRYPNFGNIKKAFEKEVEVVNHKDLGGKPTDYGQAASPTITLQGDIIKYSRKNQIIEGTIDEKVEFVIKKLKKYGKVG